MEQSIVSSRVALLLRSAEIKLSFRRFVRMNISSPLSPQTRFTQLHAFKTNYSLLPFKAMYAVMRAATVHLSLYSQQLTLGSLAGSNPGCCFVLRVSNPCLRALAGWLGLDVNQDLSRWTWRRGLTWVVEVEVRTWVEVEVRTWVEVEVRTGIEVEV